MLTPGTDGYDRHRIAGDKSLASRSRPPHPYWSALTLVDSQRPHGRLRAGGHAVHTRRTQRATTTPAPSSRTCPFPPKTMPLRQIVDERSARHRKPSADVDVIARACGRVGATHRIVRRPEQLPLPLPQRRVHVGCGGRSEPAAIVHLDREHAAAASRHAPATFRHHASGRVIVVPGAPHQLVGAFEQLKRLPQGCDAR